MKDINYELYNRANNSEKVQILIAFGIRRENAEKLVYGLDRPYILN